ncbi:uncharacterized protein BDZ99DRAFT_260352 [Mytilinidion resinicola]|uniref:Uncharacterized protein n=1 Tax=Mytilinidion resinicola TaxID=574789 RepID=A0A6A6YU36_9PEZI|nr:uncharacterized protein BDZ99DRAFT_260352 [Mytilinidion resinicola]KAF2812058.1 hypothetical protein BDZ99DRAFT_260352 [Mytilinidion resinicola]
MRLLRCLHIVQRYIIWRPLHIPLFLPKSFLLILASLILFFLGFAAAKAAYAADDAACNASEDAEGHDIDPDGVGVGKPGVLVCGWGWVLGWSGESSALRCCGSSCWGRGRDDGAGESQELSLN